LGEEKLLKTEIALRVRPRAYIVGAIAVALVTINTTFIAMFTDAGQLWTWPISGLWMQMYFYWPLFAFLWPFILSAVAAILRSRNFLNSWELAIVVCMLWVTWLIPSWFGALSLFCGPASGMAVGDERWIEAVRPVNVIYGPSFDDLTLWKGLFIGGSPVPWNEWFGFIIFNTIWVIVSMYGFMALIANLLRKQWIEIEALPFPNALPLIYMIKSSCGEENKPKLFNKWLCLGFLITVIQLSPLWLPGLDPAVFPVTVTDVLGPDLSPLGLVPYFIPMVFNFEIHWISMGLFIPVRMLLSFVISWFIAFWILPIVWTTIGVWDVYKGGLKWNEWVWTPGGWGAWGPVSSRWAEDFGAIYGLPGLGIMLAVLIIPLFKFRGTIKIVLSSIWKKYPDFEKDEPISLRLTWLLLIVMFVIWLILTVWAGGPVLAKAVVPFTIFYGFLNLILIGGISIARAYADYGRCLCPYNDGMIIWTNHVWGHWYLTETWSPWYGGDDPVAYTRALIFGPWEEPYGYSSNSHLGPSMGIYSLLESYKVAHEVGVHPKYIFKAYWIAIPISVILTFVFALQFSYMFGLQAKAAHFNITGWPAVGTSSWPVTGAYSEVNKYAIPQAWKGPTIGSIISLMVGFIIGVVLYYLSIKYPSWPINPVSMAIALAYSSPHWFTPLLMAFIIKYLVIHIGGLKLFEEKVQPFAVGSLVAAGFLYLLTGYATAYRAIVGIG